MKCPNGCCDILLQYTNNLQKKNMPKALLFVALYSYMTQQPIKYY